MRNKSIEREKLISDLGKKTKLDGHFKNCQFLFTMDSPTMRGIIRKTLFIFPDSNFIKKYLTDKTKEIKEVAHQIANCYVEIRKKSEFKEIHNELYFYPETVLQLPDFNKELLQLKSEMSLESLKDDPQINLKFDKNCSEYYLEVKIYGNSDIKYLKHIKKFQKVLPTYLKIDKRLKKTIFKRWLYYFLIKRGIQHKETNNILSAYGFKPFDYNHGSREIKRFEDLFGKTNEKVEKIENLFKQKRLKTHP